MSDNTQQIQTHLESLWNTPFAKELKVVFEQLHPTHPNCELNRKNTKLQTDLAFYIAQLGNHQRVCEFRAASEWEDIRSKHKTVKDSEMEWKTTKNYQHWKTAKSFREDLTNLIYALRHENKSERIDSRFEHNYNNQTT